MRNAKFTLSNGDPEAFWARVNIGKEIDCWEWQSTSGKGNGYSSVSWCGGRSNAHRIAYALTHPEIDIDGLVVHHLCNNPKCCNPSHLLHGTHNDNVQDRVISMRSAQGEKNGRSKLTERKVRAIRECLVRQVPLASISTLAGVDPAVVEDIRDRKTWKWAV